MNHSQAKEVIDASAVPFERIDTYDRRHFPASRTRFLRHWIHQTGGYALAAVDGDEIRGYAVMRPCRSGYKIGPLFAANPTVAESLFTSITSRVPGQPIFLDVPEINSDASALAARYRMSEVFGCARMVLGPIPQLPDAEIFGVTTFELG